MRLSTVEECINTLQKLLANPRYSRNSARHSLPHALLQRIAEADDLQLRERISQAIAELFLRLDLQRCDPTDLKSILDLCVVFRNHNIDYSLRRTLLAHTHISHAPFYPMLIAAALKGLPGDQLLDFVSHRLPYLPGFAANSLGAIRGLAFATNTCAIDYLRTIRNLLIDPAYFSWCLLAYVDVIERTGFALYSQELSAYVTDDRFDFQLADGQFLLRLADELHSANPSLTEATFAYHLMHLQICNPPAAVKAIAFIENSDLPLKKIQVLSNTIATKQFHFEFDPSTGNVNKFFTGFEVPPGCSSQQGPFVQSRETGSHRIPAGMVSSLRPAARIFSRK